MAALLGHHTTLQDLQYTKLIAHTPQQYPRRQCAAVTRWENINWIIICTSNSPSHWHTPSRHHQPQLPSLTCTTSNPPILFNTSTARGSRNLEVRNQFYQQVLYDALNSPGYFLELTMFRGTAHNTTHTNNQPQLTTQCSNIHYWQADAEMTR
jgi:hypothetical protein